MPRIRHVIALVWVGCLLSPVSAQTPTVSVFPSLAPNFFGSPSYPGWEANAITALEQGLSSAGSPTQPTYYQQIANGATISPFLVTEFPSWMLKADPGTVFGPAYANELGNRLYFNLHIVANGQQFSVSQLSLTTTSSDPGNFMGFNVPMGTYGYDAGFVGLNYGADRIKGTADDFFVTSGPNDFFVTSGPNTQLIDELFARGTGVAPEVTNGDPGATNQEKIDLAVAALPLPFTFTGTYTLNLDGSSVTGSAFVVVGVPEPATVAMTAAGAAALGVCCFKYRRRRRVRRKPAAVMA